jgi:hypothetical protein
MNLLLGLGTWDWTKPSLPVAYLKRKQDGLPVGAMSYDSDRLRPPVTFYSNPV